MTITITGDKGEFICNIAIDGENGSVLMQGKHGIKAMQGTVSIKGYDKPIVKTKIIETTKKYDKDGKLVEKITREETSEDDTRYVPNYPNTNFNGMVVHTNPPYYSYCGTKCESQSSIGIGQESHA